MNPNSLHTNHCHSRPIKVCATVSSISLKNSRIIVRDKRHCHRRYEM